jgi:hypothetical protein
VDALDSVHEKDNKRNKRTALIFRYLNALEAGRANVQVLLALAAGFPASQYWVSNCAGCDITEWTEPNSGHLFMAHQSMPQWVNEVVTWLASRGISPK